MNYKIPFNFLPEEMLISKSRMFLQWSGDLENIFTGLSTNLKQAKINIDNNTYLSIALFLSIVYTSFFAALFIGIGLLVGEVPFFFYFIPPAIFLFTFVSIIYYPKVLTTRRMKEIDSNLIPALRHMLIEVKSGVTLFEAMHGVSKGYGEVSNVFTKAVNEIATGKKESTVLSELSELNPSFSFRRAIWQISNALRAGSDIGKALESIIYDLTQEQITAIRKYGQELNPWTMIYMIAAVIFPSLGITFLVIIASFTGIAIPDILFPIILFSLMGFQVFFMNFVKNKRPAI